MADNKNPFKILMIVFLLSGLGLITAAYFFFASQQEFVKSAVAAEGEVIDFKTEIKKTQSRSDSGINFSKDSLLYFPVISFQTTAGEKISFVSSSGSSPAAYGIGDKVPVLYQEQSPQKAQIAVFSDLWLLPLILGGLGFVDLLIVTGLYVYRIYRQKQIAILKTVGIRLETDFVQIQKNLKFKVNNKNPFVVVSKGIHEGEERMFYSDNFWKDPAPLVQPNRKIVVYVHPQNPKKYYMEVEEI